jgi:hypothetical protein
MAKCNCHRLVEPSPNIFHRPFSGCAGIAARTPRAGIRCHTCQKSTPHCQSFCKISTEISLVIVTVHPLLSIACSGSSVKLSHHQC